MRWTAALLLFAAIAHADYDETEYRLKSAGVDAALRKRIHTAIDRGVMYLLSIQQKNGAWKPQGQSWRHPMEGETVFATLALRHAGTPPARNGVKRALGWLIPEGTQGRRNLGVHVYLAGPMAMLLQANKSHEKFALAYGDAIAGGLGKLGWWHYGTRVPASGGGIRTKGFFDAKIENLSTAQFAALGLWAAERVRGKSSRGVWRRHLESLIKLQMRSGSWRYAPKPPWNAGGYGYYTGTFMGIANFLLAEAGTRGVPRDRRTAEKLPQVKRRAMFALERDAAAYTQLFSYAPGRGTLMSSYYGLYALEKAAIFADRETLGGTRWYVEGAKTLCDIQAKDGSWNRRSITDTAFALLFLLRASKAYHPTTPRDAGRADGPVSGGPRKLPPMPESKKVPIADAERMTDKLEKALHARRASDLPTPGDVLEIAEIDARVEGNTKAWRKRWSSLLWKVLAAAPRGSAAMRTRWDALQVAAARVLTRTGHADDARVRRLLERGPLKNKKWEPSAAWWNAVLGVLFPVKATPKTAHWLADELARADIRHRERLAATLVGLRLAAPGLGLKDRKQLVRRLVLRFEGKENEMRTKREPTNRTELDWDTYGAHVITTLNALARDPKTGAYALTERGTALGTTAQFRDWLRR